MSLPLVGFGPLRFVLGRVLFRFAFLVVVHTWCNTKNPGDVVADSGGLRGRFLDLSTKTGSDKHRLKVGWYSTALGDLYVVCSGHDYSLATKADK
jgi:hypothetical protein